MTQAPQQQTSASGAQAYERPGVVRPTLVLSNHEHDVEWQRRILATITGVADQRGIALAQSVRLETHSPAWWPRDGLASLPEGSVVVALLSDAFLAALEPHDELEQLLERIGRSVEIIPVVIVPCNWERTPFITRQGFPRSARSLSDVPGEQIEEELLFLAELVLERLSPAKTADTSARTVGRVSELPSAHSVKWLVQRAARLASRTSEPVAPVTVLTVMAESGNRDIQPVWVCDIFRRAVDAGSGAADFVRNAMAAPPESDDETKGADEDYSLSAVSPALYAAFFSASEIARRVSADETIHARHLLAALITAEDDGPALLRQFGVERGRFCQDLVDFVAFDPTENRAEWERILLDETAPDRRLFDFHADSPGDIDLLGIDRDVAAFATLIAARDVNPPLSVGLFGDWGSGKSFFMRQLRKAIAGLAREARESGEMQCKWPFYKRIVQVEFNAWHYVDGNLWASLVQHILDNLRPTGDKSTSRELQQHLLKELNFASSTELEARAAVVAAASAVTDTRTTLTQAEADLETKRGELEKLAAQDVTTTFVLKDVASFAANTMAELRLGPAGDSADDLKKALSGAKAVVTGGSPLLTQLQRAKDRGHRRLMLVLSLAFVPFVVLMVRWSLNVSGVDLSGLGVDIASVGTALAGLLSALAVWVRKGTAWLAERRKEVEEFQQQYDAGIDKKLTEHKKLVAMLGAEVQRRANELAAARHKHEEAKQRVEAARAELEDATSGRLLARFVEDRAGSTDYRKHLGVLAVVRRDFESLSDLIQEENWRMLPPAPDDGQVERIKPKFTSLEEERKDENVRINRIVLYIDDLDRCPPGKVVDVLQAVHLLLAFPLFVVVVGVDARWIARSLESRYRELLLSEKSNSGDRFDEVFGRATTNDYLEKIFQVPYWIRPMDPSSSAQMVRGLLQRSVESPPAHAAPAPTGTAPGQELTAVRPAPANAPSPQAAEPSLATTPATNGADRADAAARTPHGKSGSPIATAKQQLASLVVHDAELEIISSLNALLGRSPRSLKRFVNVYRLLKAGLSPAEQNQFHRAGLSDSWAVLFLLAIDTGAPLAAHPIFNAVSQVAAGSTPSLDLLRAHMNDRIALEVKQRIVTPDWAADWRRVDDWLESQREACASPAIIRALDQWAPRVARYSFHAMREKLG